MKNYFLLLLAMLSFTNANAQNDEDLNYRRISLSTFKSDYKSTNSFVLIPDKKLKSERHYKSLRTVGIVTTGVGIGIETISMALFYDSWHNHFFDGNKGIAPWDFIGMAGGSFAICGGLTMWVMGHRRLKKVRKLNLEQSGNNISLVYKF